jgi:hypothetical protein
LPAIAVRISARLGRGVRSSSATADMSWPGVQKPHWKPSWAVNVSRSRSRSGVEPSTVPTAAPSQAGASVRHDSTGRPSRSTVHEPQVPSAQATFVPVMARSIRSTSASERCGATSSSCSWPLMVNRTCIQG